MARPSRNCSPDAILRSSRTFFATTKTSLGRRLFQPERNAGLLIDVLRSLVAERKFRLEDFVVMHLLISVDEDMTIENAMQLIKGRYSYRLSHELGLKGEVWQRGFSEVRVVGKDSMKRHREYIAANPVKAGLVREGESYPFCYRTLAAKKKATAEYQQSQGLKPER